MGKVNHETSVTMQAIHIPRIVRLIKYNPGLTTSELYALRPFNFKIGTLKVILVSAKRQKDITCVRKSCGQARWFVSNHLKEDDYESES